MNLFDYQKEAVDFVGKNKKVYLALDMGMGKTLTSMAAAAQLAKKNALVIAEKNEIVNSENFKREVDVHLPETWDYLNLREEPLPVVDYLQYVCGINPDALEKHELKELVARFDSVTIDEATMAKTTTTKRFKVVHKLCKEMEHVVLLSGTPMMNGAAELFAPLLLLDHRLTGDGTAKSRMAFESIFAGGHRRKIRNTGIFYQDYAWWAKGANHVRELRYLIRDKFFFKRKQDSGIFKKKTRAIEWVPMSVPWIDEYKRAWDAYLLDAAARDVDLDNVMELQRLIENGQCYQVNSRWKVWRVADDIAAGRYGDQRIVVFTMFIESFGLLEQALKERGVRYKTFDELQEWKKGDEQVLIGRIKAHGKGGNVPEASVCLFVDMDFVPANNIQAENRIDRPEQKKDMTVIYYLTEGDDIVDSHVRGINQDKARKIDEFMRPLDETEIAGMPAALEALYARYPKDFKQLGFGGAKDLLNDKHSNA